MDRNSDIIYSLCKAFEWYTVKYPTEVCVQWKIKWRVGCTTIKYSYPVPLQLLTHSRTKDQLSELNQTTCRQPRSSKFCGREMKRFFADQGKEPERARELERLKLTYYKLDIEGTVIKLAYSNAVKVIAHPDDYILYWSWTQCSVRACVCLYVHEWCVRACRILNRLSHSMQRQYSTQINIIRQG